jgi:hypothetical protein
MPRDGVNAAEWIPFRWPAEWPAPALEVLKGTPINCLVVNRREGFEAVLEGARNAGLAVAGLEGEAPAGVTAIRCAERSKLDWGAPEPVLAVKDAVWPGIQPGSGGDAGPTGAPWVDSNGWFIQLARVRAPAKTLWMVVEPPAMSLFGRAASYELAVADAETYGARWVVALDERLRAGLVAGNREALDTWQKIADALAFFQARRHWAGYRLVSVAAVISDFLGPNEELAGEILNLAARRPLPVRIIEKAQALAATFEGLKAVIYPDQEPPPEELRKKLLGFVRGGGLLVANHKWGPAEGEVSEGDTYRRFEVRKLGRGRLAVATEEMQDPYAVALDAHLLMSRRHDPLRFFNAASMNSHYTVAPEGRRALLQILNYSLRPAGHPVAVSFPARYRGARLWSFEGQKAAPLETLVQERGVEIHLPGLGAYAAVELEA